MIYEYFRLQYIMINRKLKDFGINPYAGYVLMFAGFLGFSFFLFDKSDFAEYIYIVACLYFITKLNGTERNDFLKICFCAKHYKTVRFLENLSIAFPFLIFMTVRQLFIPAIILLIVSGLLAGVSGKSIYNITLPTPFSRKPFEFVVGFRNTFLLLIAAYILVFIAVAVDNFNLGIFSLLLIFLIILIYYIELEPEYFVWIYNLTPLRFLKEKIKTALIFSFFLCIPVFIALGIYCHEKAYIIILFTILGYLCLINMILAKYSTFPEEINPSQIFLLATSLFFPVLLIFTIPFFLNRSIQQLENILK